MIDVTVVIATHGDDTWRIMGNEAQMLLPMEWRTIRVHEKNMSLAQVRNYGLSKVETDYVVFLDADDNLSPDYFNDVTPTTDVTVTSVSYNGNTPSIPLVWAHEYIPAMRHQGACEATCLLDGNYIHIGAIIRTEAIRAVGGFDEYPVYEDWALWLKMQQNGATFANHPESIYLAAVRESPGHRNKSLPRVERNKIHEQIYRDIVK